MKNTMLFLLSLAFLLPTSLINAVDEGSKKEKGLETHSVPKFSKPAGYSNPVLDIFVSVVKAANPNTSEASSRELENLKKQTKIDALKRKNESLKEKMELEEARRDLMLSRFQDCVSKYDNETCLNDPEFAELCKIRKTITNLKK